MPNINLTDSRKRDAVVKAENTGVDEEIRYVDSQGSHAYTRKILKATVDHDYETLVKRYSDDPEKLGLALVDADPEVDMEKCGVYLWGVSKVYVNSEDGIVYRIEQTEIVRDPFGKVKETRPRKRSEANVDSDVPLTWTGRQIDKGEAARRFLFSSKLQIVHVNGLTYDFLYGMASELAKNNTLMMVGGGARGRDPLVFRSGSIPYRGFLEGRIDGDKYILLLHLSNMELKLPQEKPAEETEQKVAVTSNKAVRNEKSNAASEQSDDVMAKKKKATVKKDEVRIDGDDGAVNKRKNKAITKKRAAKSTKSVDQRKREVSPPETGKKKSANKAPGKVADGVENKVNAEATKSVDTDTITSDDLGVWLKSIRMGKYLKLFVDNEIDVDVLPDLTEEDLKELDIPIGSRRRLLKAVAESADLRAEVALSVKKMAKSTGRTN